MEYLMTYGWAILIIAVALAVLFQLGVFSGGNFTPKAQAGACQVQKTASGSSVVGECQGQLPEFAARVQAGYQAIVAPANNLAPGNSVSATVWFNPSPIQASNPNYHFLFFYGGVACSANELGLSFQTNGYLDMATCGNDYIPGSGPKVNFNSWNFGAVTISGKTVTLYLNGQIANQGTLANAPNIVAISIAIGDSYQYSPQAYNGMVANLQIYNTTLSPAEVNAIYLEGIGGAPVRPENITGWWPLNGNANDYSGNNHNGQIYANTTFTSSWQSNYTAP